jgi:hypothetical protein
MTFDGLGKIFEGDTADMCAEKFPLNSDCSLYNSWIDLGLEFA